MRRRWGCWALVLGSLLLLPIMIQSVLRMMLYPAPPVPVAATPAVREVLLTTGESDRIVGWWANTDLPEEAPVVVYFHGNGENLQTLLWSGLFDRFVAAGGRLFAIDYPGYGKSGGKPTQRSLTAAGVAAVEAARHEFPGAPLVVVGWSLGAAVAAQVVSTVSSQDLAALALLSPWHDLPSVAGVHYPGPLVSLAIRDRYDSAAALRDAKLPVVIVHGEQDGLIPFTQGQRLAAALPNADLVAVSGAGHNDLMSAEATWRALTRLLAPYLANSETSKPDLEATARPVGESPR